MASPSDQRPPVALVTGLEGFTGRYVAEALVRAGYEVRGLEKDEEPGRQVDLLDREAVRNAVAQLAPQLVVHLAAIAFVAHGDVEAIYRVNVVGTRNLLEALSLAPTAPTHVVLASSANIYGNAGGLISEDVPAAPQNDYAVSKLAMEYMARLWMDRLPITIARPFNYSGVGQSENFLLPKIVSHFRGQASRIELGNLDVWREFNDVRAVADIYARLACLLPGGVFNICSGQEYSLRSIIGIMETISGHRLEVVVNPQFVRPNEVKRLRGDPARLAEAIGTRPAIELADTLRWMYEATPA